MSGRRLLDAAKLLNVTKSIAKQHVALRSQQFDVYSKTSTLAKAVKNQTDRVAVTTQAAIALARRFNEPDSRTSYASAGSQQSNSDPSNPESSTAAQESQQQQHEGGLAQDHYYERSEKDLTKPQEELNVHQEKPARYPLADGSIPPEHSSIGRTSTGQDTYTGRPEPEQAKAPLNSESQEARHDVHPPQSGASTIPTPLSKHDLSPETARRLQRDSEFQIPSVSTTAKSLAETDSSGLSKGHDQDVYYDRASSLSSDFSSVPRSKIPKSTVDTQGSDEKVKDGQINADVFYSSGGNREKMEIPQNVAVPEQEQAPEGVNVDVFRTAKVARMLGGKTSRDGEQDGLHMKAASRTPMDKTKLSEGKDQDTFNVRQSESTEPAKPESSQLQDTPNHAEDVTQLADDIAKDVESSPSATENFPADLTKAEKEAFQMRESRVPSSRFGRLWQYAGLGTSMAFGAVGEGLRRVTGGGIAGGSLMLSPGNMERLVAKLSRMRGAALKLGQMISFQDLKMLPAPIQEVLQRVQDSADYMPASQRNKVLAQNLGSGWRNIFSSFDEVPMAAASIGQVHKAVLASDGQAVAVKVQYPGVASSIDSDLNNLSLLLTASRLLPRGLYLDKTIANARVELAWECDYVREAEWASRFKTALADDTDIFTVPSIISEASGQSVLTAELMTGTAVTKLPNLDQSRRDWIGTHILRLCLREITEFHFMQTDPNWTNFLYNESNRKLELLDFGASRDYPPHFIDPYIAVLRAAARDDRAAVRDLSIQLGYLTGVESKTMVDAHVNSVLTLAEPFTRGAPDVYDFRDQTITDRVRGLIPVMVRERLAPPPEETYSLHRKLSGAFLLCARLGSRVRCKELFEKALQKHDRGSMNVS